MSLTYTTLQSECLTIAKRTELTTEIVECIRRAEGMLRRQLIGYELQATLDEDDRSSDGVYTAPSYATFIQNVFTSTASLASYPLNRVGRGNIRRMTASAPVLDYAHYGSVIEFRGVPATDQEMEVHYIGQPAPLTVTATNALLDDHEDLYISGALFVLYSDYTEEIELAERQLEKFNGHVETLNETIRRKLSGGIVMPGYNLGNRMLTRGY